MKDVLRDEVEDLLMSHQKELAFENLQELFTGVLPECEEQKELSLLITASKILHLDSATGQSFVATRKIEDAMLP